MMSHISFFCTYLSIFAPISTNGVHLSHISSCTGFPSLVDAKDAQAHRQDKHTNKNRPHTFIYTEEQTEMLGMKIWECWQLQANLQQ